MRSNVAEPYPKSSWSRQPGARTGATVTCRQCGQPFYVEPWRLRSTITPGYCSLQCWGKWRSGKRSAYIEQRRSFTLTRKGEYRCRACGSDDRVHAHHAIPVSMGTQESRYDLRNLLPLCIRCHMRWHKGVPLARSVFTEQEWDYLSSLELDGRQVAAYLDKHYPAT